MCAARPQVWRLLRTVRAPRADSPRSSSARKQRKPRALHSPSARGSSCSNWRCARRSFVSQCLQNRRVRQGQHPCHSGFRLPCYRPSYKIQNRRLGVTNRQGPSKNFLGASQPGLCVQTRRRRVYSVWRAHSSATACSSWRRQTSP